MNDSLNRPETRRVFWWIIGVAFLVRLVSVLGQPIIGADSARFLEAAHSVEAGDPYTAFRDDYHPLTSFTFGVANRLQNAVLGAPATPREDRIRRERAAYAVGILSGLMVVGLLMAIAREAFPNVRPGLVGILAAFHPYLTRAAADIMSDSIFLSLFLLAVYLGLRMADSPGVVPLLATGGAIGLAYLTRPEALVLGPALVGYWVWRKWREPGTVMAWSFGLLVATAILVFPYVLALYYDEGVWTLTRKKSLLDLLGFDQPRNAGLVDAMFDPLATWRVLTRWFFASPEVLAVGTGIGLFAITRRREWRPSHVLFLFLALALAAVLSLVGRATGDSSYVTKRHALILATLSLPFAARGVCGFADLWRRVLPERWGPHLVRITTVGVCIAMGVKAVAPQRQDQVALREAADFILDQDGPGAAVFSDRDKISYYCRGHLHKLDGDGDSTRSELRAVPGGWLVFYREKRPDLVDVVGQGVEFGELELAHTFVEENRSPPRHLDVYRWRRDDE